MSTTNVYYMACSHCDFEFTALMSSCDQTNSDVASVSGDCCEDIFMRYYGFYQFSTIVCKCFRIYLLCFGVFLESLQVYVCFGTMWWLWIILDIKTKETRSCSLNQPKSTFRVSRWSTNITFRRSTTKRESEPLVHDWLEAQVSNNYKTTTGWL